MLKQAMGLKATMTPTWVSFDEAIKALDYYKCNGLGFMLGNGYFGVDLDNVIENKKLVDEFALTLKSFTELSQSGKGIHIICKGILPLGARRKDNIEMYDSARFFALTGNVPSEYNFDGVHDRTEEIKTLWEKYLNPTPPPTAYVFARDKGNKVAANLSNEEIIIKATESKKWGII